MKFKIGQRVRAGKHIKDGIIVGITQDMNYVVYSVKHRETFAIVWESLEEKRIRFFEDLIYRLDPRNVACNIVTIWNYMKYKLPISGHDFEIVFEDKFCEILKCTRCDELAMGWYRQPYYTQDTSGYTTEEQNEDK